MVEELLSSGDFKFLNQSKIRIALENKILSWEKYKNWIQTQFDFAAIRTELNELQVEKIKQIYTENKKTFIHYGFWSEDLIAVQMWDEQLIFIGLMPNQRALAIPNSIFILCPPSILNQIILTDENETLEEDIELMPDQDSESNISLLEIDPNISKPLDLNFSNLHKKSPEMTATSFTKWSQIEDNHQNLSEIVRKKFDGYVVLKLNDGYTSLFKMDEDLIKENLSEGLFKYQISGDNPFAQVYKSQMTESFNLEQLGLVILDFKYACITPLKLGPQVLGFIIGFKISAMTAADEETLESILFQTAA